MPRALVANESCYQLHMNPLIFANRREAGAALAAELERYRGRGEVVVLALPRGGVPVGYEVARARSAPLAVFVVRKLGAPGHRELAMGAIASGGVRVLNRDVIGWYGISPAAIEATAHEELAELERRERAYREGRGALEIKGKIAILVDDGLATGSTMKAAVQAVRQLGPARLVVAAPVGAPQTCSELQELADEVVCACRPEDFAAVGQWYTDFSQTEDAEVRELLREAAEAGAH
jgi:putative phosphoribosyl transferase